MFDYTNAFPQFGNFFTLRFTWIILATFIFLSGYFTGLKRIDLTKQSMILFFQKRILRIYPLYLIALMLFFVFGMSGILTSFKAAIAISLFIKPAPPTLWFVIMLIFFYALSPLLISHTEKGHAGFVWAIYFILSFMLLVIPYFARNLDVRVVTYFPAFYFGLFTSLKGEGFINQKILVSLFLVGVFISIVFNQNYLQYDWLLSTLMVSTTSYFLFVFFKNTISPPETTYIPITILAYSSYCMYLFHRPIYIVLKKVYFPSSEVLQILYLVLICLPCIIIISYFSQKFYDIMIRSLTKRLTRTR